MENSSVSLFMPALILLIGLLASKLSKITKIPDIVVFLFSGVLIGPAVMNWANVDSFSLTNQFILTFGAAFILYDGGREVKLKVLNKVKITVMLLATVGTLLSASLIAVVAMYIFKLNFIYAFLIGACVASTDPAALVPVFSKLKIVDRVKQTVISESAFNDAVAAILVISILTVIKSGTFSLLGNVEELVQMSVVGIVMGIIVGLLFSVAVSDGKFGLLCEFAPLVSILAVLTSYSLAEALHGSGYMSCFVTGLICGNKKTFKLWVPNVDYETQTHVRETVTAIMKISIFILLGMHVDFKALSVYWLPSLVVVTLLIFVVRPLTVLLCTKSDVKTKWEKNEILFMMWVRETGVIPAALSGMIVSQRIPNANIVSSVVFMTILVTLLFQATSTSWVANKLGLIKEDRKESIKEQVAVSGS